MFLLNVCNPIHGAFKMRYVALALAVLFAATTLGATSADAAPKKKAKTMSVQLADGRTVSFRMQRIGGRMMAVTSIDNLRGFSSSDNARR